MSKRILILQGNPDPNPVHFGHALEASYAAAAREAGHEVRIVAVAAFPFLPFLRNREDWLQAPLPQFAAAQDQIRWADHLVLIYPLWMGDMPGILKTFLEQIARPGFAFEEGGKDKPAKKLLTGKSARVVVTMGMPGFFYRWYYRAHSLKSLERNILAFVGFKPVRSTVIGSVEASADVREKALLEMARLGVLAE
jgi:putative NADPH-quinone reductase